MEDWKIKIAVLWSVLEFSIVAVSIAMLNMPGFAGETPEVVLALVVTLLIPPIMAFVSLTLKDKANRWLNIIVGIVFIVMIPFGSGFEFIPAEYLGSMIIIAIVEVVALALIVWYAWKSKRAG